MPYKTELHMHTNDVSICARVTPQGPWRITRQPDTARSW